MSWSKLEAVPCCLKCHCSPSQRKTNVTSLIQLCLCWQLSFRWNYNFFLLTGAPVETNTMPTEKENVCCLEIPQERVKISKMKSSLSWLWFIAYIFETQWHLYFVLSCRLADACGRLRGTSNAWWTIQDWSQYAWIGSFKIKIKDFMDYFFASVGIKM